MAINFPGCYGKISFIKKFRRDSAKARRTSIYVYGRPTGASVARKSNFIFALETFPASLEYLLSPVLRQSIYLREWISGDLNLYQARPFFYESKIRSNFGKERFCHWDNRICC